MKTKRLLFYVPLLLALMLGAVGCSSDDDEDNKATLCNTWVLVSYGNESNEVLKEAEGYYYEITFLADNSYSGQAYYNKMWGEYNCSEKRITISRPFLTESLVEGFDPDKFFKEHLSDVSTYSVSDTELRLYYSKDEYFKFRIKK